LFHKELLITSHDRMFSSSLRISGWASREYVCPNCRVQRIMTDHHLALLKSLALRPTRSIAANLAPIISALQVAGYVALDGEGWTATAVGCATIEQARMVRNNSGANSKLPGAM
jgi:hypothetical protein